MFFYGAQGCADVLMKPCVLASVHFCSLNHLERLLARANNAWERILVVDVGDGKIALHFPWFNRFAMMTYSDMAASAIFNWPPGNAWK
jgi:hypothetical protein